MNERTTTITWLNRQTKEVAEQRLWDIMEHNIQSPYKLITYVGGFINDLRMVPFRSITGILSQLVLLLELTDVQPAKT